MPLTLDDCNQIKWQYAQIWNNSALRMKKSGFSQYLHMI